MATEAGGWRFLTFAPGATAARRRPRVVDALVAGVTFGAWLVLLSHGDRFGTADLVLLAASALPVAGWRLSPLGAFAASTLAAWGLAARGLVLWPPLAPAVALYLLAASRDTAVPRSRRDAWAVVGLLVGYLTLLVVSVGWVATDLAHPVLGCAVAWFAGERSRLRRQQIADLHERAHQAADSAAAALRPGSSSWSPSTRRFRSWARRPRVARPCRCRAGCGRTWSSWTSGCPTWTASRPPMSWPATCPRRGC